MCHLTNTHLTSYLLQTLAQLNQCFDRIECRATNLGKHHGHGPKGSDVVEFCATVMQYVVFDGASLEVV